METEAATNQGECGDDCWRPVGKTLTNKPRRRECRANRRRLGETTGRIHAIVRGSGETGGSTQPRLAKSGAMVLGFLIFTEGADGQPMLFGQIEGDAVQLAAPLIGRLEVMDIGTEAALILRGLANRVAHRLGLASPVINLQLGDERLPVR